MKNFVASKSSQYYEFGSTRNRGRKPGASALKESPIEIDYEGAEFNYEEDSEISEQTNADDDEDYKPEPKIRVTRSASKPTAEKKHDFKFEIGQEEQQSDFYLSSTTSIDKKPKGRIKEELIGIHSKKQKKD